MATKPVPFDGLVINQNGVLGFKTDVFLSVYDEFAQISAGKILMQGNTSVSLLNESAFGRFYQLAVALLTAHRLAIAYDISSGATAAGKNNLSSTSVTTSISASTSSMSESSSVLGLTNSDDPLVADYGRTAYGLELLELIKTAIPAGEIVHGGPLPYQGSNQGQWPSAQGY